MALTEEQATEAPTEASDGVIYVDLSGTDDEEESGTEAVGVLYQNTQL